MGKKQRLKKKKKVEEKKTKERPPFKLDLACGMNKQQGFTGVDRVKKDGVDVIYDLEKYPWPWQDESVDEIYCAHFVEHITDLVSFVNEIWRVLKVGSKAVIIAPYYNSMRAWQDPTHKRAISEATFLYFNKGWRDLQNVPFDEYRIKADFDFSYGYFCTPDWAGRNEEARNFAIRHYTNVVNDIQVILVKRAKEEKAVGV